MALSPTNLTLAESATTITASWGASATAGLGGWKVYWRKKGVLGWPGAQAAVIPAATLQYRITGLEPGAEYEVQVRALEGQGALTATGKTVAPEVPPPPGEGIPVASVPAGVPGSWHPEFADGFGAPFGTAPGEDNLWFPNNSGSVVDAYTHGDNSDELQVYNGSQVSVDGEGLRLRCLHSTNVGGTGKNFVSGVLNGSVSSAGAAYKLFRWKPTAGQAFAFEIVWKLPVNTGEMDPAFWSLDPAWTAELDHPEGWGWGHPEYAFGIPVWIYKTPSSSVRVESGWGKNPLGFDPTTAFHKFTTVMNADGSLDFYTDGTHRWHCEKPPGEPNRPWMGMVVQNALRSNSSGYVSGFTSGFRDLQVRSVAVYTDAAHAGQNVQNAAVAPGTRLV